MHLLLISENKIEIYDLIVIYIECKILKQARKYQTQKINI